MSITSLLIRRTQRNVQFVCHKAVRNLKFQQNARQHSKLAIVAALQQQQQKRLYQETTIMRCHKTFGLLNKQGFHTSKSLWSDTIVRVPAFAESISEGDIRFTCKVGDSFAADDAVMEIETDKTTMPVSAPFAGTITAILVNNGDTVKSGQELFTMKPGAAPAKAAAPAAAAPAPAPAAAAPPPPPPKPPAAASPPSAAPPPAAAPAKAPSGDATTKITGTRTEHKVKMTRMRIKIAARLKDAQNTCAMLTTFNEIDMSFAMDFRKANLDAFIKKNGVKLGFMSIFSKACCDALQDQPVVNAVIIGQDMVYRDYVDISVAVAGPRGLFVPVIRNVESSNYAAIEKALGALAEKAKNDAITVQDMEGGTFTISNGGVFGSLMGTPIINPPQSAILGMHGIVQRPIAVNGQVVIRPMMYVALTYDHRIIDGREAVLFLRKIKSFIETPAELAKPL